MAGARTRSGARRSGPGRRRASAGLAVAGAENGRRLAAEVADTVGGHCAEGGKEEEDCGSWAGPGILKKKKEKKGTG